MERLRIRLKFKYTGRDLGLESAAGVQLMIRVGALAQVVVLGAILVQW